MAELRRIILEVTRPALGATPGSFVRLIVLLLASSGFAQDKQGGPAFSPLANNLSQVAPKLLSVPEEKPLRLGDEKALLLGDEKSLLAGDDKPLRLGDEKPLRLGDEEPLLLLDGDPTTNSFLILGGADNSRCQVCHINFMMEALTLVHARTNIGCATCHGPCDAHIADESWASGGKGTPPDIMYPRSRIRFKCLGCHDWVKLVESDKKKKDLKDRPDHQAVLDGTNREKPFCTDCHGKHRMVIRRCKWK